VTAFIAFIWKTTCGATGYRHLVEKGAKATLPPTMAGGRCSRGATRNSGKKENVVVLDGEEVDGRRRRTGIQGFQSTTSLAH
jgi:hypothetical protein